MTPSRASRESVRRTRTHDAEIEAGEAPGRPPEAPGTDGEAGVKHFVVDTNVLLHNPNALFVFK
jgi:hypothetical protein